MKTDILLLLLLTFVSKIFSEVAEYPKILITIPPKIITTTTPQKIVTTTTVTSSAKAPKTIPSAKSIPYTTTCSTESKMATVTTSVSGIPTDVPVYTVVPKLYEHCTKYTDVCQHRVTFYDFIMRIVAKYSPITCPNVEPNQEIVAVADPNQENIYIPQGQVTQGSVQDINVNQTEYFVHENTLYCYEKYYTTDRFGGKRVDDCVTTLEPVEVTTEIPVTTVPSETHTIETLTVETLTVETLTVETPVPTTTPPKIVTTTPTKIVTTPPKIVTTTTTTTTVTKTLPSTKNPKSIPYTTSCRTEQKLATITTSLNGAPTDIPVYTIVPKSYEHCTKYTNVCSGRVIIYDFMPVETATFNPIACPDIELNQDIVAIADPDQINTPKIQNTLTPSIKNVNHTEYHIQDKTLYCYEAQYTTMRSGGKHVNDCITTLDPVEIPTEQIPVTTTPEEVPTTTSPSECNEVTVTVKEKEIVTITKKETVTVTV